MITGSKILGAAAFGGALDILLEISQWGTTAGALTVMVSIDRIDDSAYGRQRLAVSTTASTRGAIVWMQVSDAAGVLQTWTFPAETQRLGAELDRSPMRLCLRSGRAHRSSAG